MPFTTSDALAESLSGADLIEKQKQYQRDGFCALPTITPPELLAPVPQQIQAILNGEFETGIPPVIWAPEESPTKVRIIDQPQVSNRAIYNLVSQPVIGQAVAAITGAPRVQLWAVSLMYKPPGGKQEGGIGWHQDWQYFTNIWEDGTEVVTTWLAVSNVTVEAGALRFVPGSHRWGLLNQGDLNDPNSSVRAPAGQSWNEVPLPLPPGAISMHHSLTYHASGMNHSNGPRLGFALHMLCSEKPTPRSLPSDSEFHKYLTDLENPAVCPVVYDAT